MALPLSRCCCASGRSGFVIAPAMIDEPATMMALATIRVYSNPVMGVRMTARSRSRTGVPLGIRGSRFERPRRSCCQTIRKPARGLLRQTVLPWVRL